MTDTYEDHLSVKQKNLNKRLQLRYLVFVIAILSIIVIITGLATYNKYGFNNKMAYFSSADMAAQDRLFSDKRSFGVVLMMIGIMGIVLSIFCLKWLNKEIKGISGGLSTAKGRLRK